MVAIITGFIARLAWRYVLASNPITARGNEAIVAAGIDLDAITIIAGLAFIEARIAAAL